MRQIQEGRISLQEESAYDLRKGKKEQQEIKGKNTAKPLVHKDKRKKYRSKKA